MDFSKDEICNDRTLSLMQYDKAFKENKITRIEYEQYKDDTEIDFYLQLINHYSHKYMVSVEYAAEDSFIEDCIKNNDGAYDDLDDESKKIVDKIKECWSKINEMTNTIRNTLSERENIVHDLLRNTRELDGIYYKKYNYHPKYYQELRADEEWKNFKKEK